MVNKILAQYPFYLIDNKPFMKIDKIQATIYWGATDNFGICEPFKIADYTIEPSPVLLDDIYSPDYFTTHYCTITDVVLCHFAFRYESFTIDLSKETITFFDDCTDDGLIFSGKKVYLSDVFMEIPIVAGRSFGQDLVLQIDIGDELSILPPELLKGQKPIGEQSFYMFENDKKKTRALVYEVPIRLSYEVTIVVKARCMSPRESAMHSIVGTHGCIGVDLIRNNVVTFHCELIPQIKKYRDVMYLNEFKV